MKFNPDIGKNNDTSNKKNRGRNILWFNPPFCKSVKTNIGRIFLKLVRKHFHKNHNLHKIFNTNSIKISYSCMSNIKRIIMSHNSRLNSKEANLIGDEKTCSCRRNKPCPLNGNCLQKT